MLLIVSVISAGWVPQTLRYQSEQDLSLQTPLPMVATLNADHTNATVKLFGCIPISTTAVEMVSAPTLTLGGQPFGIKILSKGVLVVGIASVETPKGEVCPGKEGGLLVGDVILAVNDTPISTNQALSQMVTQTKGAPLTLSVERKGTAKTLTLQPVTSSEGIPRIGIWVRDSTAGLGTLTFYHPQSGVYGGLGHGVCDNDTGELMPLSTGEIVKAKLSGIEKGTAGKPGQLYGGLLSNASLGSITKNCSCGVYGTLTTPLSGESLPLGYKQEVQTGEALLYSSVSGSLVGYTCQIEKISLKESTTQNLIIRITDPDLLALTGGIVQGMSGSPLVQNGKLIGAVTHVFVNQPTRGYGVFAETMWETASSQISQLQNAS